MSHLPDALAPSAMPRTREAPGAHGRTMSGPLQFALSAPVALLFIMGRAITFFARNDFLSPSSASRSGALYQDLH